MLDIVCSKGRMKIELDDPGIGMGWRRLLQQRNYRFEGWCGMWVLENEECHRSDHIAPSVGNQGPNFGFEDGSRNSCSGDMWEMLETWVRLVLGYSHSGWIVVVESGSGRVDPFRRPPGVSLEYSVR
jgi:hypothetical protein